jgi:hypothetical protein
MPAAGKPRVEYPANVREFARRLHGENGWNVTRILASLAQRGYYPSHNTVRAWVDDAYAEERRRATRIAMRRRNGGGPGRLTRRRAHPAATRLQRLRDLREHAKLSYRGIADLMSFDFEDVEITEEQVRAILDGRLSERKTESLLWPKGASA